jgi:hypothetical protein
MRCKHCGALLEAKGGAWQRLLHGSGHKIDCAHCHKSTSRQEAEAFGTCFGAYVEDFEGKLSLHIKPLPELSRVDAAKIMETRQEQLREITGLSMMVSHVVQLFRPVMMEQAHGHEIELALMGVGKANAASGTMSRDGGEAAVVVLGQVEDANKHCVRQWEAMIAKVGTARFVVHATACGDDPVGEPSPQQSGNHEDAGVTRARSTGEPTGALVRSHGSTPHARASAAH